VNREAMIASEMTGTREVARKVRVSGQVAGGIGFSTGEGRQEGFGRCIKVEVLRMGKYRGG